MATKMERLGPATKAIRITPEKGANPRIARLGPKMISMLETYPKTTDKEFSQTQANP
jgi:hypothetical protein